MKWYNYYKYDEMGLKCYPQLTYEPLISQDHKKFCMNFHPDNSYQNYNTIQNRSNSYQENVLFFFRNEVEYLNLIKNETFAPKNIDIDQKTYKIYFDWNSQSCNHLIEKYKDSWPKQEWLNKLEKIINRQIELDIIKPTIYSHCHFIDHNREMIAFDYYSCIPKTNPYIHKNVVNSIVSENSAKRLAESCQGDYISAVDFMKNSIDKWVQWGDESLKGLEVKL